MKFVETSEYVSGVRNIVRVEVKSVKELKSKIKAYNELFGEEPTLTFYADNSFYERSFIDGEVYEGYMFNGKVEGCKSLELSNKFLKMDNGIDLGINGIVEITLFMEW